MKSLRDRMWDDLLSMGICASNIEIVDGKVQIKYIDPMSDELKQVIYNSEHSDSQMTIYNVLTDELSMQERSKDNKPTEDC